MSTKVGRKETGKTQTILADGRSLVSQTFQTTSKFGVRSLREAVPTHRIT
jgi:hypothetical protein